MPEFLKLSLYALILAGSVMTLVWWHQLYTRNAGIVDGWWSYLFGMIAIVYALLGSGNFVRISIVMIMAVLWSFRLGTHLLIRNTSHTEEDPRYKKIREEYGAHEKLFMWRFFMYQAISNVVLSVPFLLVCLDKSAGLSPLVWLGTIIWAVAIVGETMADRQLKLFKNNPANKQKVCQVGLWKYSRHPNYFFEWLIWVSFAVAVFDSPNGWLAICCPVLMYLMLNKVTGIPMLEELAVKSKGEEYIRYQQTTSAFIPWFRKDS